jgi:hypothetical protein
MVIEKALDTVIRPNRDRGALLHVRRAGSPGASRDGGED